MEERYTVKDINKLKREISLGRKIKITGRRIIRLPKVMLQKIKTWYKVKKAKLYEYAVDEAELERDKKDAKIEAKIEKVEEKISSKEEVYNIYAADETFQKEGSIENDYLNALSDNIASLNNKKKKLTDKQIKVNSRSFGLFKTSRLALNKLAKAKWNSIQDKINERKNAKEEKKTQKTTLKDAAEIINKKKNYDDQVAELNNIYNELQNQAKSIMEEQQKFMEEHDGMTPEAYIESLNQDKENTYTEEENTDSHNQDEEDTLIEEETPHKTR